MENEKIIKSEKMKIKNKKMELPINLIEVEGENEEEEIIYSIEIDGVIWCATASITHAIILFELLKNHVQDFMTYEEN